MGWTHVEGADEDASSGRKTFHLLGRADFQQTLLRDRLKEYFELGAGFTKWRAVISITDDTPTSYGLSANAHALARFAALSQEAGLVPIVEPEVLRDGDHSIDRSAARA